MRQRVSRGLVAIDARLDLHGLRQAAAHTRLTSFLHRAHREGARIVVVVTGKGSAGTSAPDDPFRETGVLRRLTPLWLSSPELRRIVVGFEEASPRHGGAGALYVRLRGQGRSPVPDE